LNHSKAGITLEIKANGGPSDLDKEWATCLGCLQVLPKWQSAAGKLAWQKVAHYNVNLPIFRGYDGI